MAFNFGASNPAAGGPAAELGPELPDVIADVRYLLIVVMNGPCRRRLLIQEPGGRFQRCFR